MKNKNFGRKTTAVLCALAISAGQIPALAASASDFSDMPNNWAKPALEFAIANGLIQGYNGLLRPNDKMTRAEMATVLNQAFAATAEAAISFTDVPTSAWYYTQVAKAIQMQTFVGMNDTQFGPNTPITREQAFSAIARAFRLEDETTAGLNSFSDKNEVSGWAAKALSALVKGGYIVGDNGKLRPQDTITRAEFCQVMYQLIAQFVSESGEVSQLQNGNILVNHAGVTVKNANVTGDLVAGDGIMAGTFTVRDTTVGKRLLIRGGATNTVYIYNTEMKDGIVVFNPNNTVLIVTDSTPKVKNNLNAQTSVILQGAFGTVTVAKDAIVTVKAGSKVDNWVFEDGATMEKNVIVEQSGGSSGGGGGGGGTTPVTPTTKYAWKLTVNKVQINNTNLLPNAQTIGGEAYDASTTKIEPLVKSVVEDNEKLMAQAASRMLAEMQKSTANHKRLIDEKGKISSITMQSTASFGSTNLLAEDKQNEIVIQVNAKLPATSRVDRNDVVAALGNVVKTTKAQQTDADKTMNQLNNQASNAKTEAEKDAARAAIEAEKKSAVGQQKILEEILDTHTSFFGDGTDAVIKKCEKEIGIQGIEITTENAKDLEKTYKEQYNNMQRVLADQISKLDALLAQFNTTPRGNVAVMAANTKSADDKLTMKVPVSINIGEFMLENQDIFWDWMKNLFAENDQYYTALRTAPEVDMHSYIVQVGDDYYLKAKAGQTGIYEGNDFRGECAAYLAKQMVTLEPMLYDVFAKAKIDETNKNYPEERLQEILVSRLKTTVTKAWKSSSDGNDNNANVAVDDVNFAEFVKQFRKSNGKMTVKEAVDLLGADGFAIEDKVFTGANAERFVQRAVDALIQKKPQLEGKISTDTIMNRLKNYDVTINAEIDFNTAPDTTGNQ